MPVMPVSEYVEKSFLNLNLHRLWDLPRYLFGRLATFGTTKKIKCSIGPISRISSTYRKIKTTEHTQLQRAKARTERPGRPTLAAA